MNGPPARWTRVVGTIGIILGVLIFVDQIDDLWMQLTWTEEDWRRIFSPEVAELITRASGPAGWHVFSGVLQMGLGALLVAASLALRRRRRWGVPLCRLWSWLAIAWAAVDIGWALWVLTRYASEVPGVSPLGWQALASLGVAVALVVMLAFPVFLLLWFSRPEVRAEYETWTD